MDLDLIPKVSLKDKSDRPHLYN